MRGKTERREMSRMKDALTGGHLLLWSGSGALDGCEDEKLRPHATIVFREASVV
jgi:hypothetical protein